MSWLADLSLMLFPDTCQVCGDALVDGEEVMCLRCDMRMPRCNYHLHPLHPVSVRFAAFKVARIAAMFPYMRHNEYARLIQKSKYNGHPQIDRMLAGKFARELLPSCFFSGIDLILPVPMHFWKQAMRGFNQAAEIARGISAVTGLPVSDNLVLPRRHATQTRRNASQRMANAKGRFSVVYPHELEGRHVLIVDDVITTGATILACADAVREAAPTATVSVLALSATRFRE